jgi:ADP-ribose pyrophosphatase YjhB (NUDIX family)
MLYDEIIEVLDDRGEVLYTASRSAILKPGFRNFRLVSCFVRTKSGIFHMFRRAYHKASYGGKFGSVGGCVTAGESYEEALARELYEETSIVLATCSWKQLGYLTPSNDNTIGHVALYEVITEAVPVYSFDDFAELRAMDLDELKNLCITAQEVTHNLPIYVQKFY